MQTDPNLPLQIKNLPMTVHSAEIRGKSYELHQVSEDGKRGLYQDKDNGNFFSFERDSSNNGQMSPLYGAPQVKSESLEKCLNGEMNSIVVHQFNPVPAMQLSEDMKKRMITITDPLAELFASNFSESYRLPNNRKHLVPTRLQKDEYEALENNKVVFDNYIGFLLQKQLYASLGLANPMLNSDQIVRIGLRDFEKDLHTLHLDIDTSVITKALINTDFDILRDSTRDIRNTLNVVLREPSIAQAINKVGAELYTLAVIEKQFELAPERSVAFEQIEQLESKGATLSRTGEFKVRDMTIYDAILVDGDDPMLAIPSIRDGEGKMAIIKDLDAIDFVSNKVKPDEPKVEQEQALANKQTPSMSR
jgi:hypothetical protein